MAKAGTTTGDGAVTPQEALDRALAALTEAGRMATQLRSNAGRPGAEVHA